MRLEFSLKRKKTIISKKCLDFLLKSHRDGQINAMELEFVINQVMVLNSKNITESQFMWIYDMTLANQQSQDILMNIKESTTTDFICLSLSYCTESST